MLHPFHLICVIAYWWTTTNIFSVTDQIAAHVKCAWLTQAQVLVRRLFLGAGDEAFLPPYGSWYVPSLHSCPDELGQL